MNRIEEFKHAGKSVIYMDFSGFKENTEYKTIIDAAKTLIREYPHDSLYTITNMTNAVVNSNTHDTFSSFTEHNKPFVKLGLVCGADTTTKIIGKTVATVSGRSNLIYVSSKDDALDYLTNLE